MRGEARRAEQQTSIRPALPEKAGGIQGACKLASLVWQQSRQKPSGHKLAIDKKELFFLFGIDSKSPSGFNTRLLQHGAKRQLTSRTRPDSSVGRAVD